MSLDYAVENVVGNPYIGKLDDGSPRIPTPRQALFLCNKANRVREALYGGAAGGGKSDALLMAALQYVHVPGYRALILRKTFSDLALPGAIMDRAMHWMAGTDAKWNGSTYTWTFPSGATLTFGYLQTSKDKFRYQGSEFQFIAFDEETQFLEDDYTYLFSRLRRLKGAKVPLRMRGASNPGGIGHAWVKKRFMKFPVNPRTGQRRLFVSAKITDNPHLDQDEYIINLQELGKLERERLLNGDWDAEALGDKFRRSWCEFIPKSDVPWADLRCVRYWDYAATEPTKKNQDPDYTSATLLGFNVVTHKWYIIDSQRARVSPGGLETMMRRIANQDGLGVPIRFEREGGSAGKIAAWEIIKKFPEYDIKDVPVAGQGDKEVRANPFSNQMENGNVIVVEGEWNEEYFEELELFPGGEHDDQVDSTSGAHHQLAKGVGTVGAKSYIPGSTKPVTRTGDLVLVGEQYVDDDKRPGGRRIPRTR